MHRRKSKIPFAFVVVFIASLILAGLITGLGGIPEKAASLAFFGILAAGTLIGSVVVGLIGRKRG